MSTSDLPVAELQGRIAADLRERGYSSAEIDGLQVTVEMWRRIAREAARSIGRSVQTLLVGRSSVTAVLRDWPATPEERAIQDASMRQAMKRLQ